MKILLADDDAVSCRLLQRTLERSGFDVICVNDGQQAVDCLLATDGPRMAILDWVMPKKDGLSVCQEIRASKNNPNVYLILLTSRETSEDVVTGFEAGADDYLIKPCNPEEMKARVRAGQRVLRLQDELTHEAHHDALTDLPNRAFFTRRLSDSVSKAQKDKDYKFAVLFVDIDRFKIINDSLGHLAGDELMKQVAQRLREAVRVETQICHETGRGCSKGSLSDVVARIGGDEFVILLDNVAQLRDGIRVAERIQGQLKSAFFINGQEVFVTASIGISASDGDSMDATEILRSADAAMYKAKVLGKARYEVSEPARNTESLQLFNLMNDLRGAIDKGEFEVRYQPIVSLDFRYIKGVEALVRWRHPTQGIILPSVFIPVAEETGSILAIGTFVMLEACRQTHEWNSMISSEDPIIVCVNISPRQFEQGSLADSVRDVLRETGLNPRTLELELTENLTMQNVTRAKEILSELDDLGVSLSLDDFGTGYSSLSYLHRFPIRTLKIDRSFIANIEHSTESKEIVHTVVNLGHNLGMRVIAEGIETEAQLEMLRKFKCDLGQGYLFSHPLEASGASELLKRRLLM